MYSYSGIHSIEHALCWLSIRPGHKRMQHCWMIHVACCWELLRKVWNRSNFYLRANVTNGRNKWLQQWPNNFGSCCIRLHVWSEVIGGSRNFLLGGGGPIFNSERTVELFFVANYLSQRRRRVSLNAGRRWRGKYCFASRGEQIIGGYTVN